MQSRWRNLQQQTNAGKWVILMLMFLLLCHGSVQAKSEPPVCKKISRLLISGEFRKLSVSFKQMEPNSIEYQFDFNKDGKEDRLVALCGNGSDAVCEMSLLVQGQDAFDFALGRGIRFIEIKNKFYFINGISIDFNHRIEAKNYAVHQLHEKKLSLICEKF